MSGLVEESAKHRQGAAAQAFATDQDVVMVGALDQSTFGPEAGPAFLSSRAR